MDNIKIEIPSLPENIRIVESFIDNAKERFSLEDDIYGNIMIAVTEAVNNAILHGNGKTPTKTYCFNYHYSTRTFSSPFRTKALGSTTSTFPIQLHQKTLRSPGAEASFL